MNAATDPITTDLLRQVKALRQGVAWQCLTDRCTVVANDLTTERRWPEYSKLVRRNSAIRSAVGYCLDVEDRTLGALVFYDTQREFFTPQMVRMGAIFAAHAAIALDAADAHDQVENLRVALTTNRRIGMAIGILMRGYAVTEQESFDLLRVTSQQLHRKLHDVAEDVIDTGVLPEWPVGRTSAQASAI